MNILVITPSCHFANAGAAQRDIYAGIRLLKEMGHTVSLLTIDGPSQDPAVFARLQDEDGVSVYRYTPPHDLRARVRAIFLNPALMDGSAFVFDALVKSDAYASAIKHGAPDVAWVFCSYAWPAIRAIRRTGIPVVFRSHNFESNFFWESLRAKEKWNPLNWLRRSAKYVGEYMAVRYADRVATLPFDQAAVYRRWKKKGVHILTLLFLPESIRPPRVHAAKKPIDLFYLGASYHVVFHLRGAALLITEIAPKVELLMPSAFRFHICGSKLPKILQDACVGNVIYEGYVPNLDRFLETMDAGVFPVMTGKTMKGKVFETLARALPMVISTNCLGGYPLYDGQEVLLADTVDAFVQKIIMLANPDTRTKLSKGAAEFVTARFVKEQIITDIKQILNEY